MPCRDCGRGCLAGFNSRGPIQPGRDSLSTCGHHGQLQAQQSPELPLWLSPEGIQLRMSRALAAVTVTIAVALSNALVEGASVSVACGSLVGAWSATSGSRVGCAAALVAASGMARAVDSAARRSNSAASECRTRGCRDRGRLGRGLESCGRRRHRTRRSQRKSLAAVTKLSR